MNRTELSRVEHDIFFSLPLGVCVGGRVQKGTRCSFSVSECGIIVDGPNQRFKHYCHGSTSCL